MFRTPFAVAILGLCFVACRGGDDDGGTDARMPSDTPAVISDATIQEIQNDAMPSGTALSIKGVVVTAVDSFGTRTGDFYIQEPGGGAFSGVKVFGASLDQVAAIAPGDIVDITGAKKHEACTAAAPCGTVVFENGAGLTEVMPVSTGSMIVTKVGTGDVPAPTMVDAKAIAALATKAEREAEWEKWEGVLITVTGARQLSAVGTFGKDPGPDATEFRITGVARVQSQLVELPAAATLGTCYDSITGIGDYFFNYIIAPRSAADLVGAGTGCIPMPTSVVALQSSTVTPEIVDLTDVIVTAIDDVGNPKGFWVADALTGAEYNGVYVFAGGNSMNPGTLPAGIAVGATVDILGGVEEFDLGSMGAPPVGDTITEIMDPAVSNARATTAPPVPATTASVATLADIGAAGEPWEGVLVRIGPVKITNTNTGGRKVELTDNNGVKITADDESFLINPANGSTMTMGKCYATITGVMHVQVNDNVRTINPRSLADMVEAPVPTACN